MSDIKEWPLLPQTASWWIESNSKTFRSPFNGSTQVVSFPGSRWKCTLTYRNLDDEKARTLEALIASMDGEFGRIRLRSYGRKGREPAGSPVVDISNQTGKTLITRGWTASTEVLKIGDFITVNDELKQITDNAVSNSSGIAVISFAPALRYSPPAGAAIETEFPTGIFKLADNRQGKFQRERRRGIRTAVSFDFEEAF